MLYVIKLASGITEVKETKAPEGYLKLTDPIKLELTDNGVVVASAPAGAKGAGSFSDPLSVKNVEAGHAR